MRGTPLLTRLRVAAPRVLLCRVDTWVALHKWVHGLQLLTQAARAARYSRAVRRRYVSGRPRAWPGHLLA